MSNSGNTSNTSPNQPLSVSGNATFSSGNFDHAISELHFHELPNRTTFYIDEKPFMVIEDGVIFIEGEPVEDNKEVGVALRIIVNELRT